MKKTASSKPQPARKSELWFTLNEIIRRTLAPNFCFNILIFRATYVIMSIINL